MPRDPKAFQTFPVHTDRLLSVSKETVDRRRAEYKARAVRNPRNRGPHEGRPGPLRAFTTSTTAETRDRRLTSLLAPASLTC
jgi:hypothetical protein